MKCKIRTNSSKFPKENRKLPTLNTFVSSVNGSIKSLRMKIIVTCAFITPVQCSLSVTSASKRLKLAHTPPILFLSAKIASTIRNVQDVRKQYIKETTKPTLRRRNACLHSRQQQPTDVLFVTWTQTLEKMVG